MVQDFFTEQISFLSPNQEGQNTEGTVECHHSIDKFHRHQQTQFIALGQLW